MNQVVQVVEHEEEGAHQHNLVERYLKQAFLVDEIVEEGFFQQFVHVKHVGGKADAQ